MLHKLRYLLAILLIFAIFWLGWQNSDALTHNTETLISMCSLWVPVSDGAFGMGTGGDSDYSQEEGFEVIVFNEQVYVGMEADNVHGARLWRTKTGVVVPESQVDWEEVIADDNGYPFGDPNR